MEVNALEECRTLLQKRNEATFFQKLKHWCLAPPPDKAVVLGVMLSLLLSIVLILSMKLYSNHNKLPLDTSNVIDYNALYPFDGPEEKRMFNVEWEKGNRTYIELKDLQRDLYKTVGVSKDGHPFHRWQLFAMNNNDDLETLINCSVILEHVKRSLKRCVSISVLPLVCRNVIRKRIDCASNAKYRSIDGSCNNLVNPRWGMRGASFLRMLQAVYDDDVSLPRTSVYGVPLPNPRLLSWNLLSHNTLGNSNSSMMFMNFGLLLDHDIVSSSIPADVVLACCSPKVIENPKLRYPGCMEMSVPPSDPFYGSLNVTCLEFVRNNPTIGSCPGRREQMNVMTAFIDASDIYGPSDEEAAKLRSFRNGKLLTSLVANTPMLPLSNDSGDRCYTSSEKYKCFLSGDIRVNLHVELMTLHAIWFREHNRLADELQRINPGWNDEKLYQEARRIIIAQLQHITYAEYLPIIFGSEKMKEYGLFIDENEPYDGYDETETVGVYNAFAAAAFRFGHTLVQDTLEFRGPNNKLRSEIPFHEAYNNPTVLYNRGFDDIVRGMALQTTYKPESYTTTEIRGRLLQRYYQNHGQDLSAITIQRGRDHGMPSYIHWRRICDLESISSWEDLYKYMDKERADDLREMYMSVEDIDLMPGALAEHYAEGAILGPTYLCILRKQFLTLRVGDRFWYENPNQPGSFTKEQMKELYKSNFARILCESSDALRTIQKFPFMLPSEKNPVVQCSDLPKLDLSKWTDF